MGWGLFWWGATPKVCGCRSNGRFVNRPYWSVGENVTFSHLSQALSPASRELSQGESLEGTTRCVFRGFLRTKCLPPWGRWQPKADGEGFTAECLQIPFKRERKPLPYGSVGENVTFSHLSQALSVSFADSSPEGRALKVLCLSHHTGRGGAVGENVTSPRGLHRTEASLREGGGPR